MAQRHKDCRESILAAFGLLGSSSSQPFRIGTGEKVDLVYGDARATEMWCWTLGHSADGLLQLLAVSGAGPMVNGNALDEGERWTLSDGDVVARAAGEFAIENIWVEADAKGIEGTGQAALNEEVGGWMAVEEEIQCLKVWRTKGGAHREPRPPQQVMVEAPRSKILCWFLPHRKQENARLLFLNYR